MTTQDHYSLRWNNHQNHILRAFDTLLQTKTLVDVTLVCAETSIRAHKMVLSACSPFFQRVFSETPCKHPVIVLKDFRGWVVQAIVDFMYRGEISVPQEKLQTLIQAGESLQVRGLVENTVPGNTPTPAASPDDFGIMDTSVLSAELNRCSNYEQDATSMMTSASKLILPSHVYVENSHSSHSHNQNPDSCTSPMPRRKQARPRRRSGECGPQDFSKPLSPPPDDSDVKSETSKSEDVMRGDKFDELIRSSSVLDNDDNNDMHNNRMQEESSEVPENLCTKKDNEDSQNEDTCSYSNASINNNSNTNNNNNNNNNNNISVSNNNNSNNNNNNNSNNNNINNLNNNSNNDVNSSSNNNNNNNNNNNSSNSIGSSNNSASIISNNNNNRIVLSLKDIRHLNKPPTLDRSSNLFQTPSMGMRIGGDSQSMKSESMEAHMDSDHMFSMEQIDLSMAAAAAAAAAAAQHHQQMSSGGMLGMGNHPAHRHDRLDDVTNQLNKEFTPSSPMSLPPHFNQPEGPQHPPSPLPFPGMSSALTLTPPHMFGLDSPLALFPPGMDPSKLYNPLMEMSDPRGLSMDHPPFLKKKMSRPKGQHSAPRGGPPRSWTNAELTEALQHVWNKKMTTSQASRIFGIPYNSLLMYVRGKYGKSLKLEQLRKDCISGPPIELLTMGMSGNNNNNKSINENRNKEMKDMDSGIQRSSSSEPDLLSSPNPIFNPFPPGFYPDFPGAFPGLPLSMLNLLPPERHQPPMHMNMDEDCKSDRSKQSLDDDFPQPLALNRDERRELLQQNGQD